MNFVEQEIVVRGAAEDGPGAGVHLASSIFREISKTVRPCVRMALTGRSTSVGKPPVWLQQAWNVRVVGFSRRAEDVIFRMSSPTLGDAAPKVFEQTSFWDDDVRADETALDLMGKLVHDVTARQTNSDSYDESMLITLATWDALFQSKIKAVMLPARFENHGTVLDLGVVSNARELSRRIPCPRQVRIVGIVDMVRHSTRSLGLRLGHGDEVRCAIVTDEIGSLGELLNREVTVLGKAVYRPSGAVLRVDVEAILNTSEGRDQFSYVPLSFEHRSKPEAKSQTLRTGVAAIFGTWPGEETDSELLASLSELRG